MVDRANFLAEEDGVPGPLARFHVGGPASGLSTALGRFRVSSGFRHGNWYVNCILVHAVGVTRVVLQGLNPISNSETEIAGFLLTI